MHLDDLETGEQAEQPEQATRPAADVSRDPTPGVPDHALPDDAEPDPLIDPSRDPTPGVPDHALPDDE